VSRGENNLTEKKKKRGRKNAVRDKRAANGILRNFGSAEKKPIQKRRELRGSLNSSVVRAWSTRLITGGNNVEGEKDQHGAFSHKRTKKDVSPRSSFS